MSHAVETVPDGLVCRFAGRVGDDDVFALGHRVWEALEDRPVRFVLADCRAVEEVALAESDIIAYAYADRVATLNRGPARLAAVAERPDVVEALELFIRYLDRPGTEVRIFADEASARAWVAAAPPDPAPAGPGPGPRRGALAG